MGEKLVDLEQIVAMSDLSVPDSSKRGGMPGRCCASTSSIMPKGTSWFERPRT